MSEEQTAEEKSFAYSTTGDKTYSSYYTSQPIVASLDSDEINENEEEPEEEEYLSSDLEDVSDYLKLNHNKQANYLKIYDGNCRAIYESACKHLQITPDNHVMKNLDGDAILIPNRSMNVREVGALMEGLSSNTRVEEVDLSGNFLEDDSCRVVAEMLLRNTFVCRLNLANNKIHDGFGSFHKVFSVTGTTIRQVNFARNRVSDRALLKVAPSLAKNSSLVVLDLSHNTIAKSAAVVKLFNSLKHNSCLVSLNIGYNMVGTREVAVAIGTMNKTNRALRHLSLAGTQLQPIAAEVLHKVLMKTSIESLDLSDNHLGPEQLLKFAQNFSKVRCKIRSWFFDNNKITTEVFQQYVRTLGKSPRLKILSLVGYENEQSVVATGNTFIVYKNKLMFRNLRRYLLHETVDPVALFVRSAEKNNVATSDKAPISFDEDAVRENLNRLFVRLPKCIMEKYLSSLGLGNFQDLDCVIDTRCKAQIHKLEDVLKSEIDNLAASQVSTFLKGLNHFKIYYETKDVQPMIREEREWLQNRTIHCLVLFQLLSRIHPSFRKISDQQLMNEVDERINQNMTAGSFASSSCRHSETTCGKSSADDTVKGSFSISVMKSDLPQFQSLVKEPKADLN